MRLATISLVSLLVLATGGLAGCSPAEENEVPMDDGTIGQPVPGTDEEGEMGEGEEGQLFLEGELTDEGVECQAFRGDDGELYTLTGDLAGFQTGDRVRIVATPVEMSTCMQGTTVNVVEISALDEPLEEV